MNDEFKMTNDEGQVGSRKPLPAAFRLRAALRPNRSLCRGFSRSADRRVRAFQIGSEQRADSAVRAPFVILQRGFTLLELLLAVLVFSIVLGAIHVVFFSAFKLRNKTSDALERALPLQQALGIIKRDLANLVPPGGTLSGALQSTPTVVPTAGGSSSGGSVSGLGSSASGTLNRGNGPQFYTAAGIVDDNAPWAEIERVSYYLAAPTNDTAGQDLYRAVARNLLPTLQDQTDDQFLMSGVDAITFRYFNGTAWQDTWDSTTEDSATGLTNNLPRAIRLELQLHNEKSAAGARAPVELVVPILVLARTNLTATIE